MVPLNILKYGCNLLKAKVLKKLKFCHQMSDKYLKNFFELVQLLFLLKESFGLLSQPAVWSFADLFCDDFPEECDEIFLKNLT